MDSGICTDSFQILSSHKIAEPCQDHLLLSIIITLKKLAVGGAVVACVV